MSIFAGAERLTKELKKPEPVKDAKKAAVPEEKEAEAQKEVAPVQPKKRKAK